MSGMVRRLASLLAAVVLVGAVAPAFALADGDPASDVLLGQNVYYPYSPPVPQGIQRTLNAETAAAKKAGLPLKVALIASPVDLGVIPELFGKPADYAKFLDKEISFQGPQPLLVVMPAGYGIQGVNAKATAAVTGLALPKGKTSVALAQSAITAVAKLAAADGHPVKGVAGVAGGSTGGGSSTTPLLIGLIVAAVLVAGALVLLRRKQGTASAAG
jgi:LPXTG-motif cell wall-anchored protein